MVRIGPSPGGLGGSSTDATLLARANHTGTQLSSTISDFVEAVQDRLGADLVAGTGVTLVYDDAGTGRVTITASGGGAATDATTAAKGIVQLAGDLGGTAAAPTVPGLASKAATGHTHAYKFSPFSFKSVLVNSTADSNPLLVDESRTITELGSVVNTPSAGAAIIVTYYHTTAAGVRTTIGTVSIAAGARIGRTTALNVAVVRDDVINCRITQIGSTTAGADLTTSARAA